MFRHPVGSVHGEDFLTGHSSLNPARRGVAHLLGPLTRLVDSGKSVIVIEHNQAVMAHADWIIDLGPGAGSSSRARLLIWL